MSNYFLRKRIKLQHYAIWMRDWKPAELDDVIGNSDLIDSINEYISTDNIPNLILSGPHGCGKKTIAELTVKKYLGEYYDYACLKIDGSFHRGKDAITNTNDYKKSSDKASYDAPNVMSFAKSRFQIGGKQKIVLITNFDQMTAEAQNAMRRIIEIYAKTTRFVLVCNELDSIIEAIQSRCVPLRASTLSNEEVKTVVKSVMNKQQEGLSLPEDILNTICILSSGDVKKAINYAQVITSLPEPTVEKFYKIFNIPPVHNIKKIIYSCQSDDTYQVAYDIINKLLENGYSASDILDIFIKTVATMDDLSDVTRIAYMSAISRCAVKTSLIPRDSHLLALIARLGTISREGYVAESI